VEDRKYTKTGALYANQREVDETPEEYAERVQRDIETHPDDYFQRGEVVRLESEIREHDLESWLQAQVMRDARRMKIAPKNPDACKRYGRLCSFFEVCTGQAQLQDASKFRQLEWVHTELTPPTEDDNHDNGDEHKRAA
jgi:hypothetical protein